MKLIDLLRNLCLQTEITLKEDDKILIYKDFAFTPKGNITKSFKNFTNKNIYFITADNKDQITIYVKGE